MAKTWRMFAAVVPPEAVREDLERFLEPRREAAPFRWTTPDSWHLTTAFMPAVPEHALDDLVEHLGEAASRRPVFEARIAGGGAMPDPARARVLYAGFRLEEDAQGHLTALAAGSRSAAVRSGVEVDGGRFRPHLTLARLNRAQEVTRWLRVLDGYLGETFGVEELALFASYLGEGPGGRPRYEHVASLSLARETSPPGRSHHSSEPVIQPGTGSITGLTS